MTIPTCVVPAFALAALLSAATCGPAWAQTQRPHAVLTIYSGAADYAGNPVIDAAIQDALSWSRDQTVDYFAEYIDFERLEGVEPSLVLGDYIERKYAGRRFDVVIAITTRSLRFVVENRARLFPTASIVFAANDDTLIAGAGPDITGVKFSDHYLETLKLALDLHPTARQAFVVAISPTAQVRAAVRAQLDSFAARVPVTYLEADSMADLAAAVRDVPREALILFVTFQQAGESYVRDLLAPARLVAGAARVPVYVAVDTMIGTGAVGGRVREARASAIRAGEMARRILDGTPARDIPVEAAPLVPMFDWRQLQRWGIDLGRLPQGSVLRFEVPTVWETYRWYIIGAFSVMAVQLLLIAGLITQRARRRRAERTLRASQATLQASHRRIRRLAGGLIKAQEAVRAQIARDLHDGVCQELAGVSIAVGTLKHSSGSLQDAPTQQALAQLESSAQNTLAGVRRLSHDLHPASLRLLGLATALRSHCLEIQKRHGVQVAFAGGDVADLPLDSAVCLFRIAQEALRNAITHGFAQRLSVSLGRVGTHVVLTVIDDGRGFDLDAVRRDGRGLGLVSIEERAHAIGAAAQIVTSPDHGTTILVRAPIGAGTPAEDAVRPLRPTTRFNRAIQSLKVEVMRTRTLVTTSRRRRAGRARDNAAPVAAASAAARRLKGQP